MSKKVIIVGELLPNGYTVVANYDNLYVLAHHQNENVPEPYATWHIDQDGDTYHGSYFVDAKRAEQHFAFLCFDWFEKKEAAPQECDTAEDEILHYGNSSEDVKKAMEIMRKSENEAKLSFEKYKAYKNLSAKDLLNETTIESRHKLIKSIVNELIRNKILIQDISGKLEFKTEKLPKDCRTIYNSRNKIINAIEILCSKM